LADHKLDQNKSDHENFSVSIKDLLEAGSHFGHQTHRWNPKMRRFIFEEKNGLYIIDLAKTLQLLRSATSVVKDVVAKHRSILFVGTKKQAKEVVRDLAEKCGEFYVTERWLGGMLTNLSTIRQSIKKLERIEKKISTQADAITKKELSMLTKDQLKLERNLSGVRGMRKPPGLLIVVDPSREHIAVAEANKLGIPVMALVDTNCDPDPIQYVIPCNDDALKSIKLVLDALAQAIIDKKNEMQIAFGKEEETEEETLVSVSAKRLDDALAIEEGE
jgi:small subunit ribosomal protein S2